MAMDFEGASLTKDEVLSITAVIDQMAKNINSALDLVQKIMLTLTGESEGGIITLAEEAVTQLYQLGQTLVACIIDIGIKIGDYINAMWNRDQEAANTLRNSIESRVY